MFSANSSQVSEDRLYVEDVFSTYLYTGNASTRTITNGIDLAGKGGLIWTKARSTTYNNILGDTARGGNNIVFSNLTVKNEDYGSGIYDGFGSTGYTIGSRDEVNGNGITYASWSFREAPRFFDVVTYTGTGSARTIAHNLGSVPGFIMVKKLDGTSNWAVYHRGNTSATYWQKLNSTDAQASDSTIWNGASPTSDVFSVGTSVNTNASGSTYVAYLFAHDTTSDGIIQCGSFTAGTEVNLGWEPQWVMIKSRDTADTGWIIIDNMRTWANNGAANGDTEPLEANSSGAEYSTNFGWPTATGFITKNLGTLDCIYIAIRRGPMRTPTSGTSVFAPVTYSGDSVAKTVTSNFPADWFVSGILPGSSANATEIDRLRSGSQQLITSSSAAEGGYSGPSFASMTGVYLPNSYINDIGNRVAWMWRRAPSFFDIVSYLGTGAASISPNHNLGVVPEFMILRRRDGTSSWIVYSAALGATKDLLLNTTSAERAGLGNWNDTAPTATVFSTTQNVSSARYVWYGFASCPGVSKVGSYTGNGSSQTINCGFAAGARFVMIKRTDSTGDWYVWDTARGIVSGNDPHLSLNTTAAEVTTDDSVDTDSSGFVVNQLSATNINVSSATYIYLAVA